MDAEDGWSMVAPTTGAPSMAESGKTAKYLGKTYQQQYAYNAETTYVAGEFYWQVERGQKTFNRDFATVQGAGEVDAKVADLALKQLEVDDLGLDSLDRRYLRAIAVNYGGGPVGIDTISAALAEQRDTIEETVEPFLLQQGLIQRTPSGRMLTRLAFTHLGMLPPPTSSLQPELFDPEIPVP